MRDVKYLHKKTHYNRYGEKVLHFVVDGYLQVYEIPQGARCNPDRMCELFESGELSYHKKNPYTEEQNAKLCN